MRLLAVLAALLALAAPAVASQSHWSIDEISQDLMCPTCHEPLALSSSLQADQIRAHLRAYQREGLTPSQAAHQLVVEYGRSVRASPPTSGFGLAAGRAPALRLVGGGVAAAAVARRWAGARRREPRPGFPLAAGGPERAELERRLDLELARFEE
jgi:cytochrome c-type biogenesis protein CcmH/NrfF